MAVSQAWYLSIPSELCVTVIRYLTKQPEKGKDVPTLQSEDIFVCHIREVWQSGSTVGGAGGGLGRVHGGRSLWHFPHVMAGKEAERSEEPGTQL